MDESTMWAQKCKSSQILKNIKQDDKSIFDGVKCCKEVMNKKIWHGHIDRVIKSTIEQNFGPSTDDLMTRIEKFNQLLKEEMVVDLKYFNSLENNIESLQSQLDTQRTQVSNEIDRLSREYYYVDHMNAILGVYTTLNEHSDLAWVIPNTSVSRPQLKSTQMKDRVMQNNSQGKKMEVEDHCRIFKFSNNKTSITACNDSLNAKALNVDFPTDVPISTREPKRTVNQSVATHLKKTEALLGDYMSMLVRHVVGGTLSAHHQDINRFGSRKHHYQKGLLNRRAKSQFILRRSILDADLEVAFWKSTCYIRDLKGNDLLTGSCGTNLYSITLQDTTSPNPICLVTKASSSQAWLWHHRLSHLNFDTINLLSKYDILIGLPKLKFVKDQLCSSCELGKAKCKSFKTKTIASSKRRL
ncbi:retrovirus-related pol polyprotein from transposon TNT 1-94, partial [Tanacetum coccineum]